jgi:hypothetical protein
MNQGCGINLLYHRGTRELGAGSEAGALVDCGFLVPASFVEIDWTLLAGFRVTRTLPECLHLWSRSRTDGRDAATGELHGFVRMTVGIESLV